MKISRIWLLRVLCILVLTGCGPAPRSALEVTAAVTAAALAPTAAHLDLQIRDFPGAESIWLTAGGDGNLYALYGQQDSLFLSRSADGGLTFGERVRASGEAVVYILPIERPAVTVNSAGQIGVAWLGMGPDFHGAQVWYAASTDGGQTFRPQQVADEPDGEVAMVQVALDANGNPLLAWLHGAQLRFARSTDGGVTFSDPLSIGSGACECCQPQATVLDGRLHIVHRSLEPGDDRGDIRDIVMLHSVDGGASFEPLTRVSDVHWYLPACPIAGPSLATHNGTLYVAWMDGRNEQSGTFTRGDIWMAASTDGGQTFSPNVRINADQAMHHTLPSVAVGPGGRIHVAWEAQQSETHEAFLLYAFSDDGGQSFAVPQVIADNRDAARGNPGKPVLAVDALGHVTLAWLDRQDAHVAAWMDPR